MKIILHYRDNPELDAEYNAEPITDIAPSEAHLSGSLYVTGEHFGTILFPDQKDDPKFPIWYEVIEPDILELSAKELMREHGMTIR